MAGEHHECGECGNTHRTISRVEATRALTGLLHYKTHWLVPLSGEQLSAGGDYLKDVADALYLDSGMDEILMVGGDSVGWALDAIEVMEIPLEAIVGVFTIPKTTSLRAMREAFPATFDDTDELPQAPVMVSAPTRLVNGKFGVEFPSLVLDAIGMEDPIAALSMVDKMIRPERS